MRLTDYDLAVYRRAHGEPDLPLPPKRKKRDNEESRMQMALIRWWGAARKGFGVPEQMLFAVPNGGRRDVIGASILKKEGQRNGVSDLMLAVPRGKYHGLFLELKTAKGVLSPAQNQFLADASAQGYAAYACHSFDDAVRIITLYLTKPEELF